MNWADLLIGGAVGAVITLLGGYWFYTLQNRRNTPLLAFRSFSWPLATQSESSTDTDLQITFRGMVIPRLTRTRIALWNPGWKVISDDDVSEHDPLVFGFRDGEVLEASVVQAVRPSSRLEVTVGSNGRGRISFDFLDHGDGAVIDVVHTDPRGAPTWTGTIKRLPEGITNFGHLVPTPPKPEVKPQRLLTKGPAWLAWLVDMVVGYGFAFAVVIGLVAGIGNTHGWTKVGVIAGFGTVVALFTLAAFFNRRRYRIPVQLSEASTPRDVTFG